MLSSEVLLERVEPLTHAQRVRGLVALERRAGRDPDVAALIAQPASGDVYQRWLALLTCFTSHDGAHVLGAVRDPSRSSPCPPRISRPHPVPECAAAVV